MAPRLNTITGRIILTGLAVHAVLLPLLFYGLFYIVEQTHEEIFINDVRKYSRFIADIIELDNANIDETRTVHILDSALLGSGGVFAELKDDNVYLKSSLMYSDSRDRYEEDFAFGEHNDHIYYLSIPINLNARHLHLRMGFDERPVSEQVEIARHRLVVVLMSYLLASILVLVLLSTRLIRPLKVLQQASRRIARGRYQEQLYVDSKLAEIKELSSDLETMRRELVGINASLTRKIAEKEAADRRREELESELRQAQKLETVGVMAGGIAHELNNILLPIFLYTEQALSDLPADSQVRERLERVLKSAKRAKGLVQKILTFSRQNAKQEFKLADMKLIVEEAFELLRALIPSTVELRKVLVDDDCLVLADRDQIHQLVMNLCGNAYGALDESGGAITVTLDHFTIDEEFPRDRRHLRVGKYIRLGIHDTGHGIGADHLDRIFEPFYTTSSIGKGTGLGLSVAHGIAMSHKGGLTVESELGKGSTFYLFLPEVEQEVIGKLQGI